MRGTLASLLLFAGWCLAGCSRPGDPLDWRIEGRHAGDLQRSLDGIVDALPPDLRREFLFCFNNVKADVLAGRLVSREEQENRLCRRLRGKTVRDVLLEGNRLAYHATAARLIQESDALLLLLEQTDRFPEAQRQIAATWAERRQARIDYLTQVIGKSGRRVAELRADAR